MERIMELDKEQDCNEIEERSHEEPLLLNFWAPWCKINDSFRSSLEKIARQFEIQLIHVCVDEHSEVAETFDVRGVPDVKWIENGELKGGFAGALPEPQVEDFIRDQINQTKREAADREGTVG